MPMNVLRASRSILNLATLTCSGLLGGCIAGYGSFESEGLELPPKVDFDVRRGQVYTPPQWPERLEADLYLPQTAGRRPAVLAVHGGSWSGGSPAHMIAISRGLARRGFVVMNVAYRKAPAYLYPAPLEDLAQALRWLRDNSADLDIDARRIGAFGYSAGAHLVTLLATRGADDAPQLAAVVAGGTPADLLRWPDSPIVTRFLGKPSYEAQELWAEASPVTHVSKDDPPMYLYHGADDTLVEPGQTEALADALRQAGVPVEARKASGLGHIATFLFDAHSVAAGTAFLARELGLDPARTPG
jgi:acetyl esterase/lipase